MRRVRGAGRVLDEERLAGVDLVDSIQVINGVIGHAGNQVPARLAFKGVNLGGVAEQVWLPLVGVSADEAVEILEAHAGRPLVERPDRAGLERRRVVVLAEPGGGVAVIEENPSDGGLVLGDDTIVAGEAGSLLGDHTEPCRVMVAPRDERGPGWRAERGGVDVVVAQTVFRDAVHGRHGNNPSEGAGDTEPGIIRDDEQDVGCLLGGPMRGSHHAFDCRASFLITPPNGRSGAGSCLPSMVMVASGGPTSL